jgi:hypothetical protein
MTDALAWIVVLASLIPTLYGFYAVASAIAYAIRGQPTRPPGGITEDSAGSTDAGG